MPNEIFNQQAQVTPVPVSDIPVESVQLPSQGLVYPVGHPLCNEKSVEIRCLTAKDEDLMTSRALIKNGTVLTKLMQSCLCNKSIDVDSLLAGDRNAILVAIRITGYGNEYKVTIKCPECEDEVKHTFVLENLKVKELSAKPVEPGVNVFSFVLPMSKQEVRFKLLTGSDEAEISKAIERKKKLVNSQIETGVTTRLIHSIVSIAGITDPAKLNSMIVNLKAGDARAIRQHMAEISPSIDMTQTFLCPGCDAESEVEVPLGLDFFWPDWGK
jgi:hypothetical protein